MDGGECVGGGITRRADDSRQRAIEAGVDGGARTALVISASQC